MIECERGRQGERERGREEGREAGRGREGGREREREGSREGGREGCSKALLQTNCFLQMTFLSVNITSETNTLVTWRVANNVDPMLQSLCKQ